MHGRAARRGVHRQRLHDPLSYSLVGSGRDADIRGIYSPNRANAEDAAALARSLRVGDARAFGSIEEMVADPRIDCIWICGPNFARVENMERIVARASRRARSCAASPAKSRSARNAAEAARMVELVEQAGVLHGYLENQLFQPSLERGKQIVWAARRRRGGPPLSRARGRRAWRTAHAVVLAGRSAGRRRAQRHDVPQPRSRTLSAHEAWRAADSITPVKVSAQIASLKWSRPEYAKLLRGTMTDKVDYARHSCRRFRARDRQLRR